jgi:hypothetical protein
MQGSGPVFGAYLDTGYDLKAGDTFDLDFQHGNHSGIEGTESLTWQLFTTTTGDDSGTVDEVIASGSVTARTSQVLAPVDLEGLGPVDAASADARLFIAFGLTGGDTFDYVALDEVNLMAFSVDAPQGTVVTVR